MVVGYIKKMPHLFPMANRNGDITSEYILIPLGYISS
jgi:hypothetical protein